MDACHDWSMLGQVGQEERKSWRRVVDVRRKQQRAFCLNIIPYFFGDCFFPRKTAITVEAMQNVHCVSSPLDTSGHVQRASSFSSSINALLFSRVFFVFS